MEGKLISIQMVDFRLCHTFSFNQTGIDNFIIYANGGA